MSRQKNVTPDDDAANEAAVGKEIRETAESDTPTSSDVGKQTLTKADLGYDVTKEGVPPDDVALKTPQHPDDPSAQGENEYNTGTPEPQ